MGLTKSQYDRIILALEFEVAKKNSGQEINTMKFLKYYEYSKMRCNTLCEKCIILQKMELPYDCLCRPDYCAKQESDFEIMRKFEELFE